MDKKYIIGIICVLAIVVVGLVVAMGGGDTSSSESNQNTDTGSPFQGYQVKIIYDGSWSGAAGSTDSMNSYDGTGNKTIDLGEVSYDIVSANAQKQDGSSEKLTIQILKDGEVVKEGSTTAAYGVAQITSS